MLFDGLKDWLCMLCFLKVYIPGFNDPKARCWRDRVASGRSRELWTSGLLEGAKAGNSCWLGAQGKCRNLGKSAEPFAYASPLEMIQRNTN